MSSRKFEATQCEKKAWAVLPNEKNKRMETNKSILEISITDFEKCINGMGIEELDDLRKRLEKKIKNERSKKDLRISDYDVISYLQRMQNVVAFQIQEYESFIKSETEYTRSYTGSLEDPKLNNLYPATEDDMETVWDEDIRGNFSYQRKKQEPIKIVETTSNNPNPNPDPQNAGNGSQEKKKKKGFFW